MGSCASKKSKLIIAPPRGARLKSRPTTFAERGTPMQGEEVRGGEHLWRRSISQGLYNDHKKPTLG